MGVGREEEPRPRSMWARGGGWVVCARRGASVRARVRERRRARKGSGARRENTHRGALAGGGAARRGYACVRARVCACALGM